MSRTKNGFGVSDIVLVALFAAITYLGISLFRIPLPAAIGAPFIHFGNSLVVLSALLLGGTRGGIAGAIGLGLFDLLNGYASTSPVTALMALIIAAIVTGSFRLFGRRDTVLHILFVAIIAGASKIILEFIYHVILALLSGSAFGPAVIASITSQLATSINAVSTVIIVTILYFPLKKGLEIFDSNKGVSKV
ncbi:ECF transporter S component [Sporolactobacillus sp. Y61]|jgi:uncharacterized membrane protein|uniref:ECF transporter S component n=1 Tax=Sporolactobacillus sp. Y61 TaxID=3160863 RepID=A0AAU8IBK6_9BACL